MPTPGPAEFITRCTRPGCSAARCATPRASAGFSLVELLIATSIGAGLLVSLAATAHLFTEQVAEVTTQTDVQMEETLATLAQGVRTAWAAEVPSTDQLRLSDPFGNFTEYFLEGNALRVLRPSGAEGTLLPGVENIAFEVQTTQRLREATPQHSVQSCWASPANAGTASMLTLINGQSLAIGFTPTTDALGSFDSVTGIAEQVQSATLSRILLPICWLDASNKSFCHLHASQPHNPTHPSGQGTLIIELYEARMPGDARPLGNRIASKNVTAGSLPSASYQWWDTSTNTAVTPPAGVAWGWWAGHPTVVPLINAALSSAAIDISSMHATVLPGRAYTLVLRVDGWDELSVQTRPLSSSKLSGVALRTSSSGSWTPQAKTVTCTIEGNQTITQTTGWNAVSGVTLTIEMQDGRSLTGSANVAGQLAVDSPWLGAVPGEQPDLELAGS